ncbi:uncharacterized protein [Nicotiana sylvestris]|uniref:uncharacterized protein n=1 Tax=Nicotiana sylvestris TaxID=4096 RepID=UPI00388CEC9B
MKKDIVAYVARCLNCQQVKYAQRPGRLLQNIDILKWKWKRITRDYVVELPHPQRKFDAVWVIVDSLTKSVYFILMPVTYSSERLVEIYIREIVHFHGVPVSIIDDRGCKEVWEEGKLSPRYIRTFEILERVREVAYRIALPPSSSAVHLVFHVSMLRKYHDNPFHVLDFSTIQLDKDLTYEEEPVAILVQVQQRGQPVKAATWEFESDMRSRYAHLFPSSAPLGPGLGPGLSPGPVLESGAS